VDSRDLLVLTSTLHATRPSSGTPISQSEASDISTRLFLCAFLRSCPPLRPVTSVTIVAPSQGAAAAHRGARLALVRPSECECHRKVQLVEVYFMSMASDLPIHSILQHITFTL
jgi:hypothetical protein